MNHRSWWLLPLLLLLGFGLAGLQPVQAASGKWYRDNGNMMGSESKTVIKQLNDQTFAKITGHPQIAVITVTSLHDEEIEDYANEQFAKLGIGKKGWDNGLLLVLSRRDRKYWLEVGYGLEDVVPDGSADEIVTGSVKIALFLTNIGKRVAAHQSAIATPTQIKAKRAHDAAVKQLLITVALVVVGMMVLFFIIHAAITARLRDAMPHVAAMQTLPIYAAVTAAGIKLQLDTAAVPLFRFAWSHDKLRVIGMANLTRRGFESWTRKVRMMVPHPYWYYDNVRGALRKLPDQTLVNAPTIAAVAELLNPALADRFKTGQPYEAAFTAWLNEQKSVAGQAAVTTWSKFLAKVKPTDTFSDATLAATFSAIDFGSATSSHSGDSDDFGSGFGGGSSGGGGFGGSW